MGMETRVKNEFVWMRKNSSTFKERKNKCVWLDITHLYTVRSILRKLQNITLGKTIRCTIVFLED